MAITRVAVSRKHSLGNLNIQMLDCTAVSGATSGTVTADSLSSIKHILASTGIIHTALPTYADNVATLAFTVPAATAATKVTQGLTLTAVATDRTGNAITIAFTAGATAGAEVVTVVANAISVQVETGVSTVTQVRTAMQAAAACTALVTTTGTSAATVATASALALAGGITGGWAGTILAFGN